MSGGERGFTVIEVLVAATILLIGVLSVFGALDSARKLSLVAERQTSIAHRAQQELERLQSIPYKQLAMTAAPPAASGCPTPLTANYPTSPDCYVTGSTFAYDRSNTANTEPLAIDASNGVITPNAGGCTDGCTSAWTDGRFSGEIFDFVSWTTDPNCSGGSICAASNDYKRVTVIVTISGAAHPAQPLLISTFAANPDALPTGAPSNSAQNPLQNPNTQCGGSTCNQDLNGTAVDYYMTDSPYSGSYGPPTAGNAVHQTLTTTCGQGTCAPTPDQLITTPPTTGVGLPPCFSTDRGCVLAPAPSGSGSTPCNGGTAATDGNGNCQTGLLLAHPSTDGPCGSAPVSNTQSHAWVTPTIPAGTTVNLTGAGGMTAYLQSASGVAVNLTLCAAFYSEPVSLLGTKVNLLPPNVTQIGTTVGVNAQAGGSSPTPVSFGFNLGQAASLASTSQNLLRIEAVVWLAASAGTDVSLVYDHPYFSSQLTLIQQ